VTWRGRIAREILTGAGYGALADQIVEAVDATWPAGAHTAPEPEPAHHDAAAPLAKTPAEPTEYFDLKSLALYSRIGIRTLRGYIHRKVRPLPSYQVDKKILIRKVEFDGWLASFRRADGGDGIDSMVEEILGGLTKPSTQADTRAQLKSLPASRRE
jgi:hypothetical protein